jgi:transcription elongation factor GreA
MEKEIKLTSEGLRKYKDELEFLKTEKRKEIAEKIKEARSFGDLSENSEYDEAKNEQAKIEARIAEIEAIIKRAVVIDENKKSRTIVHLGSRVKVYDVEFDEELEYRIVGASEADPANNLISDESPVGKALIGRRVGEEVEVEIPMGKIKYQIKKIIK